jgi:3-isopropylmalate dehydrogenase
LATPHLALGILEGDDIGHEIVPASVEVASAAADRAGLRIDWRPLPIGRRALDTHGHTMPPGRSRLATWTAGYWGDRATANYPKVPEAINSASDLRKISTCSPTCGPPARSGHRLRL